jgi:hypothetical protein
MTATTAHTTTAGRISAPQISKVVGEHTAPNVDGRIPKAVVAHTATIQDGQITKVVGGYKEHNTDLHAPKGMG